MRYVRTIDPFPLQAPDDNKLYPFYARLAEGRLTTTQCAGCGRTAWPPRGFCPECGSDRLAWVDLPTDGRVDAFTVQETGLPAGFDGPRVFAIVTVGRHRIFSIIVDSDPHGVTIGQRVRLAPQRVADGPRGEPRWLPAFAPV